jgi:hypothetical protein
MPPPPPRMKCRMAISGVFSVTAGLFCVKSVYALYIVIPLNLSFYIDCYVKFRVVYIFPERSKTDDYPRIQNCPCILTSHACYVDQNCPLWKLGGDWTTPQTKAVAKTSNINILFAVRNDSVCTQRAKDEIQLPNACEQPTEILTI